MKLHLIHWKPSEADERIAQLTAAGHEVAYAIPNNTGLMKHIHASAPQAVVIDLSRAPSHGKAVALEVRRSPKLRTTPIVFAAGTPEKVAPLRELFPDALYCTWEQIVQTLRKAKPLMTPVLPATANSFERYAGRPLAQKLGIQPNMNVALFHAPEQFDQALTELPPDVEWQDKVSKTTQLIFLFAESQASLETTFARAARADLPIWVFWPKQAARIPTDITQHVARSIGNAFGFADCKVCSFNATWSGFLFRPKRK